MTDVLLEVRDLVKHFPIMQGIVFKKQVGKVHAVDGVSFGIRQGETLGLVGETGCGKTTTGRLILKLVESTSGSILFEGNDITKFDSARMRPLRRKMQIIFQDPFASLDPRMTVGAIIGEPLDIHGIAYGDKKRRRVQDLMQLVGLNPDRHNRYPHEFSGGMRQRVGVARALAVEPKLIVCDEPVSALDVSIQAQILNLLSELQRDLDLTYLFIAHDLSVVRHVSDRVAVMYLGKIVEVAQGRDLYRSTRHPYSGALLSAIPQADPVIARGHKRVILTGDVPSPVNPPAGCRFHPRCPVANENPEERMLLCSKDEPFLQDKGDDHLVACHFPLTPQLAAELSGVAVVESKIARGALKRPAARLNKPTSSRSPARPVAKQASKSRIKSASRSGTKPASRSGTKPVARSAAKTTAAKTTAGKTVARRAAQPAKRTTRKGKGT